MKQGLIAGLLLGTFAYVWTGFLVWLICTDAAASRPPFWRILTLWLPCLIFPPLRFLLDDNYRERLQAIAAVVRRDGSVEEFLAAFKRSRSRAD